ncbi:MAG: hypothetical protein ACE5Q6_07640 [Dehalococcoidia bacterium]
MPQSKELASAKLLLGGGRGLRTEVSLADKVDPRVMLMLAHDLLTALEQKGYLSPAVAQSRAVIRNQLAAWGVINNPYIPTLPTTLPGTNRSIIV